MSTVYTDRIRVVLGAVHLLSLTIVIVAIQRGVFRLNKRRMVMAIVVSTVVFFGALFGVRGYLAAAVESEYSGDQALVDMRWMDRPVKARQYKNELPPAEPGVSSAGRLTSIENRGTLRVGYFKDSLPFAFRNQKGEVVGFDVEMGHHLARDLGVELTLVRITHDDISRLFESGQIDIVMSGMAVTPTRARQWAFAKSPMDLTLGFLVPDHRRKKFTDFNTIRADKSLTLGVVQDDPAVHFWVKNKFPLANVVSISSPRSFLAGERNDLDAMIYSAEGGSAWTLLYPQFSVVVPSGRLIKTPLGYALPNDDDEWFRFVSLWVGLSLKNGTVDSLFEHWIHGGGAEPEEPRWSIIRNVLHWVE